jgi:hypothetical protein
MENIKQKLGFQNFLQNLYKDDEDCEEKLT